MVWDGLKNALKRDPVGVARVRHNTDTLPLPFVEVAWVIEKESGWRPEATNPTSHATGLLQFMPSTAVKLGTTVDELRAMTLGAQAPFVRKYLAPFVPRIREVGDVYLATFWPAALGQADDFVIATPGSDVWAQNASLREYVGPEKVPTGNITAGSVRRAGTPAPGAPVVNADDAWKPPTDDEKRRKRDNAVRGFAILGLIYLGSKYLGRRARSLRGR